MTRSNLYLYIQDTFSVEPQYLWPEMNPNFAVFRHGTDGKWFALVMDVPRPKLGLAGDGVLDIVNVKCDPAVLGEYLGRPGYLPAYHMNKSCWLSVMLDGTADDEVLKMLLHQSCDLTAPNVRRRRV